MPTSESSAAVRAVDPRSSGAAGSAEVEFHAGSRPSSSDQPVPLGGVPRALREAAESSGLDPVAELYNEALRYAQEGHLRLARERLQMLLCMAPDDGEARLMLAKVHVAGQRWQDALTALDEATACGQQIPVQLRRTVEDHLRAERAAEEEQRTAMAAREQGEIKALRQEARKLRAENAALLGRVTDLEKEAKKWAWTTAAVSSVATLFIAASLAFTGSPAESVVPATEGPVVAAPAVTPGEAAPSAATPAAPVTATTAEVAGRAAEALAQAPGLQGTSLEVEVQSGRAVVRGEVTAFKQKSLAEKTLASVSGVNSVDTSKVAVLARTKGTTHTVQKGDTLGKIALWYYGDSGLAKQIQTANADLLHGGDSLSLGQKLKIPKAN